MLTQEQKDSMAGWRKLAKKLVEWGFVLFFMPLPGLICILTSIPRYNPSVSDMFLGVIIGFIFIFYTICALGCWSYAAYIAPLGKSEKAFLEYIHKLETEN